MISIAADRPDRMRQMPSASPADVVEIEAATGRQDAEPCGSIQQIAAGQCPANKRIERQRASNNVDAVGLLSIRQVVQDGDGIK